MAVKIRLSRTGTTNRPYWRIVVMDSRSKRDGQYIDKIGSFDPLSHQVVSFDKEKLESWVAKGAQCSDTVKKIVKNLSK